MGERNHAREEAILQFIQSKSVPPTLREIGAAVGLRSTNTVHVYLHRMVRDGLIEMDSGKPRTIRATVSIDDVREADRMCKGLSCLGCPFEDAGGILCSPEAMQIAQYWYSKGLEAGTIKREEAYIDVDEVGNESCGMCKEDLNGGEVYCWHCGRRLVER